LYRSHILNISRVSTHSCPLASAGVATHLLCHGKDGQQFALHLSIKGWKKNYNSATFICYS